MEDSTFTIKPPEMADTSEITGCDGNASTFLQSHDDAHVEQLQHDLHEAALVGQVRSQ